MRVNNPSALTFDGEPVLARIPPRIVLDGDFPLTTPQANAIASLYVTFAAQVRAGSIAYQVKHATLPDGTTVRMVSNSGEDRIFVRPAGTQGAEIELDDWFRTVPTSDTFTSGTGTSSKLSDGWKVPKNPDAWATQLKQLRNREDHPGHITWCNPDLLLGKNPIVLSWRGPRDRYAYTTGWTLATGGAITAHERSAYSFPASLALASDVMVDTQYVWMNARRIDTGVLKIIAACLFEYDPSGHPGKYVLRVISDDVDGARQMICYDLVPSIGADGGALESFYKARTLSVKSSYTANDNTNDANAGGASTTPGQWDYWQRPHFNKSGTRIATLIVLVGSNGTDRESHAVSFDPTTWEIDDDVQASITGTATLPSSFGPGIPWASSGSNSQDFHIAADFEDDTFVCVTYNFAQVISEDGENNDQITGALGGLLSIWRGYRDTSETRTHTITHSVLGQLKQWTETNAFSISYDPVVDVHDSTIGTISASYSHVIDNGYADPTQDGISPEMPFIAFTGDLSRRIFAIGYPEQGVSSLSATGSLSGSFSTYSYPAIPVSATGTRARLVFDAYYEGTKILDAGTGGFVNASNVTTPGIFSVYVVLSHVLPPTAYPTTSADTGGAIARASAGSPPGYEGRFGAPPTGDARCPVYLHGAPPVYQHCAVHPSKGIAYLAGAYFEHTYGTGDAVSGLELAIVKPESTPVLLNPPAFVTGAHPTMSVPVFTGVGEK